MLSGAIACIVFGAAFGLLLSLGERFDVDLKLIMDIARENISGHQDSPVLNIVVQKISLLEAQITKIVSLQLQKVPQNSGKALVKAPKPLPIND